ncbi:ATP-binding protein [Pseudalkalibacillus hwajinpoensis]|uniref:YhaN AAA domain-containing protein n=1 Tax=Guptibacillus hwajinpoensis TaxID=208199 RepID=A0A4U1MEP3_9BACL|nr:AAA family ATPase [Pseudalkalibacillus hwajinpoensis]TKD68680.1 hypothetical protein FBF83_15865 [Pseudalkalibacillus hwajinpoensis]
MKLLELHIYSFGKFEDYQMTDISSNIQLVYGENEAGKSTLIAFIESILFGFPSRQDESYELNHHSRFGGTLTLESNSETIIVERTKGKASGDVTIYFPDGSTGNEEELKLLLKGMNRTSFRQIFFCNLTTLNDYRSYDEDGWNQVLYEAGMSGGASLLAVDKAFDKRQGELFKPGGRKPLLNEELENWEKLKKKTSEWAKKNGEYNRLVQNKQELEGQVTEQTERLELLHNERRILEREKRVFPLLKEKRRLESLLNKLPEFKPFPEDGLIRMDKWKEQAVLLSGESESMMKRLQKMKEEIDSYEVMSEWKVFLQDVSYWNEQMVLFRARSEERKELEREMVSLDSILEEELESLGLVKEDVIQVNTSFTAREELKLLIEDYNRSDQEYRYINEAFLSARDELEKEESEYELLKARLLSESEREKISNKKGSRGKQKWQGGMVIGAVLLFLGLGLYESWVLGAVASAIALIGAFLMTLTKENNHGSDHELLIQDLELRRRVEQAKDQIDRLNRIYIKAAKNVDRWEAERYQIESAIKKWRSSNTFPESIPLHSVMDAVDRITSIKKRQQNYDHMQRQLVELDYSLKVVEDGIKKLCDDTNISYYHAENAMQFLLQKADAEREAIREIEKLSDQYQSLESQLADINEKLISCKNEMKDLMSMAKTDTEEAFRVKGNAQKEAKVLMNQLVTIDSQLEESDLVTERSSIDEIENELIAIEREEGSLMKKQQETYQHIATEQERIHLLIEDGTYEDLLLQQKQKEDEMNALAWKWSVFKVASDLLTKAKARYQEERLPAVLKRAENYFTSITEGRYTAIFPPTEGMGFRVMHCEGKGYKPSELSRGTVEQLYLCIRLALASISAIRLPIFLDDIFVNFDAKRTEKAKEFIKKFSLDHQVILLTCHMDTTRGLEENIHVLERTPFSTKKVQ